MFQSPFFCCASDNDDDGDDDCEDGDGDDDGEDEDDALSPFFDCAREVIPDSAIKQICSHLKIIEGKLFEESKQMLCGIKIDPENIF